MRENEISLRKLSGGTAHLRTVAGTLVRKHWLIRFCVGSENFHLFLLVPKIFVLVPKLRFFLYWFRKFSSFFYEKLRRADNQKKRRNHLHSHNVLRCVKEGYVNAAQFCVHVEVCDVRSAVGHNRPDHLPLALVRRSFWNNSCSVARRKSSAEPARPAAYLGEHWQQNKSNIFRFYVEIA